ncbi:fimbrillin family protein [Bacteroides fragilis]|uniref:fimbrillin family protein n=1 Tax=Bacteroides fragilis TaxID=817 RepID=UPI0028114AF3|nr:fimbrillin family protein [Bacteroides fragilis]WMI93258.1 fimbrillin family protein [Bacteroides fragilis]
MNRTFIMRECLGKALWLFLCLSVAGCAEDDGMPHLSPDSGDTTDELIPIDVCLTGDNNYHSSSFNNASTRNHPPLIAEWVGVKAFSPTRTGEQSDYDGPRIASIELTEDTLPHVNTRATVPAGVYFRLIVFWKSGNSYVFQSAADYTSNGTGTPVLKQGKLLTRSGTIRVVGYSFNTATAADLGTMPSTYAYNSSTVSIPNMSKDFMTFDSGDITNVNSLSHNLPVSFSQKLCKLTITISPTGYPSNTISNCTGVYVKQGGNSTSWTIGPSTNVVAANTNNTTAFNPNTTLSTTIRMVPFAGARTITVHFNTLTVGGRIVNNNTEITSTQSIQLKEGRSYTMKIQFKKVGINVLESDINLTGNGCTTQDKKDLAKLTWADGNLKSTGASNNYVWGTNTEYGYYYLWYKDYNGNNIDPCTRLNPTTYGPGWRTPSKNEFDKLARCTNKILQNNGTWFMNATKGLFLPAAGGRDNGTSGTSATYNPGKHGNYWVTESASSSSGYYLYFDGSLVVCGDNPKTKALTVRCVKGTKQ